MKKRLTVIALLIPALLLIGGPAWGRKKVEEQQPGNFYLSPTYGSYFAEGPRGLKNKSFEGLRLGYLFSGAGISRNLGVELLAARTELKDEAAEDTTINQYRFDTVHPLRLKAKLVPFLAFGGGWVQVDGDALVDDGVIFSLGGGLSYAIKNYLMLRVDLRRMIWFEPDQDNYYEGSVGLTYLFGQEREKKPPPPPDTDRDGVPDSADKCPETPRGAPVNKQGCRTDNQDGDGDGVPDHSDACSDTPAGVAVDRFGCPQDEDQDLIPDFQDRCPGTPTGTVVDDSGCVKRSAPEALQPAPVPALVPAAPAIALPGVVGPDFDPQQGSAHSGDLPSLAELVPATVGLPIQPLLPDQPGTSDGKLQESLEQLDASPVVVSVEFDFDRADVLSRFSRSLQQVAASLREAPARRVIIAGYTDSFGSAAYNDRLSLQRALSVRDHLVGQGVAAQQIIAIGYGERWPIADNATEAGRQKNRRVVFIFLPEQQ